MDERINIMHTKRMNQCTQSLRVVQVEGVAPAPYNRAMLKGTRTALIGAGNMTEALVAGVLKVRLTSQDHLYATDVLPERQADLQKRYGIRVGGEAVGGIGNDLISFSPESRWESFLPGVRPFE